MCPLSFLVMIRDGFLSADLMAERMVTVPSDPVTVSCPAAPLDLCGSDGLLPLPGLPADLGRKPRAGKICLYKGNMG